MPDIGGKSVRVHASDNSAVWITKDVIWGHRRYVADTREIFGMLNIWSCRRFLLCEWVLTEKYISDDLQPMIQARYRAAGISAYFRAKVCWITPSLLITVQSGRTYRPYFSVILRYFLHFCDSYSYSSPLIRSPGGHENCQVLAVLCHEPLVIGLFLV